MEGALLGEAADFSLGEAAGLCPRATVGGDDWQWIGVRRAVRAFAAEALVEVEAHPKENWWLLQRPYARLAPPPASAAAGEEEEGHRGPA